LRSKIARLAHLPPVLLTPRADADLGLRTGDVCPSKNDGGLVATIRGRNLLIRRSSMWIDAVTGPDVPEIEPTENAAYSGGRDADLRGDLLAGLALPT
jgi:hypothetical protein